MSHPTRVRIDKLLVDRGLVGSRDRATRLVLAGEVWLGDRCIDKAGALVPSDAPIEIRGQDIPYVSRGGLKLAAALDHWSIDVRGRIALDIGASTGGFTDCLLQRDASQVIAIDVGYGQFAWKLRQDPRVVLFERTNIRTFTPERLSDSPSIAVVDVSFISLRLVLPSIVNLLARGAILLPMVKPQFEVGKGQVGKGGVVREETVRLAAVESVRTFAIESGLLCHGELISPVPGPKGNREYFLYLGVP